MSKIKTTLISAVLLTVFLLAPNFAFSSTELPTISNAAQVVQTSNGESGVEASKVWYRGGWGGRWGGGYGRGYGWGGGYGRGYGWGGGYGRGYGYGYRPYYYSPYYYSPYYYSYPYSSYSYYS